MNIIIVGPGAIGLLWYHHIQQLLLHNKHYFHSRLHLLSAVKSAEKQNSGKLAQYSFTAFDKQTYHQKINYAGDHDIPAADVIILCLKSFQIAPALEKIADQIKSTAIIILAHNGMGTLAELPQNIIDKHNILALLTTHGCLRSAPLTITHTGIGVTDIGLLSGKPETAKLQSLTKLLAAALPDVYYHKNIVKKQWQKLAINCVINPLTALNQIENGQVNQAKYSTVVVTLLAEIILIAAAEGINLTIEELQQTVAKVALATAKNSSSMRCDLLAKRATEIDYINGYIHQLGVKHVLATPENTKMWQAIKKLELKAKGDKL